jgi:hypothetical protein
LHRSPSAAIAFLVPGLVHQFGNLLLTIQGQALALEPGSLDRCRGAILHAGDRGSRTLTLLRYLLGEPGSVPCPAGPLLQELVELARVPVREARSLLELVDPGAGDWLVEPDQFVPMVAEGLRALVQALPDGSTGTVRLQLTPIVAAVGIHLQFLPATGSLPFPVPMPAIVALVQAEARQHGWVGTAAAVGQALVLQVPMVTGSGMRGERGLGRAES